MLGLLRIDNEFKVALGVLIDNGTCRTIKFYYLKFHEMTTPTYKIISKPTKFYKYLDILASHSLEDGHGA